MGVSVQAAGTCVQVAVGRLSVEVSLNADLPASMQLLYSFAPSTLTAITVEVLVSDMEHVVADAFNARSSSIRSWCKQAPPCLLLEWTWKPSATACLLADPFLAWGWHE